MNQNNYRHVQTLQWDERNFYAMKWRKHLFKEVDELAMQQRGGNSYAIKWRKLLSYKEDESFYATK